MDRSGMRWNVVVFHCLGLCLDIMKWREGNGNELNVIVQNGMEHNEDSIPWFGYFRTRQGKFSIPPKSEGKKYDGKWWNEMKFIPLHSAPLHPILIDPNNRTLFHTISFNSILFQFRFVTFHPSKHTLRLDGVVWIPFNPVYAELRVNSWTRPS